MNSSAFTFKGGRGTYNTLFKCGGVGSPCQGDGGGSGSDRNCACLSHTEALRIMPSSTFSVIFAWLSGGDSLSELDAVNLVELSLRLGRLLPAEQRSLENNSRPNDAIWGLQLLGSKRRKAGDVSAASRWGTPGQLMLSGGYIGSRTCEAGATNQRAN